jgi:LCP family protein required for cell wall assembly
LDGIENIIRNCVIIIIALIFVAFLFLVKKTIKKRKFKGIIFTTVIALLITIIEGAGAYYINKAYVSISNMNKSEVTYGTSLIVMSGTGIDTANDLGNAKIGIISDTDSVEGYIISQEIIIENNISKDYLVKYDDFLLMINDLYEGNVDAIFISSDYVSMFSSIDHFANIKSETKVLLTKKKTMDKQDDTTSNTGSQITEPFTMLLMGIDSTEDDISSTTSFNGDSLMLITFNPTTLNATILSIPRDTFVPITCFANKKKNKITHAAWYGESCMISTIENFTGIDINYYVKINFKGVVKLVDALGGVEVDIPYSFCEQNSNREWGKRTVYVSKGLQTLTGEQALAFARNRHPNTSMCSSKWTNYYSDDIVRGQNQQTVIKALVDKAKSLRSINKLYEILDLIEKSMDTNLSTTQILSFYNIGKNILEHSTVEGDILGFEKLYLKTYGLYIYDEGMKAVLSDQIYYKGSLDEVVEAMEINLGIKEPTIIKEFSFSINEPYEQVVVGKGTYSESSIPLVPNFTAHTKQYAINWGESNGISINFNTIESSEAKYSDGQITYQSVPTQSLVSLVSKTKGITLNIISKMTPSNTTTNEKIDCTDKDNESNAACVVPDFEGDEISDVTTWQNKITSSSISINKISTTTNDKNLNNVIYYQTENTAGKNIYDLSSRSLTIEYYVYEGETTE